MAAANNESPMSKVSKDSEQEANTGRDAVMSAYNNLLEAKEHFKRAAGTAGLDLKNEANNRFSQGKVKAGEWNEQANSFIRERPLAAVGIAFAAGFVVSKLCTSSKK